ncbi:metallophosphoesterase [Ketobacter alkanivorans]|uniref:metallophosphoesterase n=1 Tax=Ketobacter alkanivorans TaxID=1917421 RepID=UPI001F38AAF9|nr:metallophosphoesterase [Ketobacter alkanivorans]
MIADDSALDGYDIIGDVHGCADALVRLLRKLEYREQNGVWHHPARKAVFVGDIIDRGPQIRHAMNMVRRMVDSGSAYMVLGNHEFNAVAYSSHCHHAVPPPLQRYYRRLGSHLKTTLDDYRFHLHEWQDLIVWLRQLPIFLEFTHFRVVHACWDARRIAQAADCHQGCVLKDDDFLAQSLLPATEPNRVVERLLKGTEMELPAGRSLLGADGVRRTRFRTKFWSRSPQTYGDVVFQPDGLPDELVHQPLSADEQKRLLRYGSDQKALFVGHYWCQGKPRIIRDNIACLDYSAVKGGLLVAYRMGREHTLSNEQFVWVQSD